jgi:hypothetical protein
VILPVELVMPVPDHLLVNVQFVLITTIVNTDKLVAQPLKDVSMLKLFVTMMKLSSPDTKIVILVMKVNSYTKLFVELPVHQVPGLMSTTENVYFVTITVKLVLVQLIPTVQPVITECTYTVLNV